jgi:DNA-directed RNA polymerase subunit M/transcription elongation factor TFIIS
MKEPTSMEECIYFSNRTLGEGKLKAWVFKENCPKCKSALMGKPKDEKTGKPKIRAKEYVCPSCTHTLEKEDYEDTLTINVKYTCPHCSHSGETQQPFKWKNIQRLNEETGKKQAIKSIRFQCEKCKKDIDVTKKMK